MSEDRLIQSDSYFTTAQVDRSTLRTRISIPASLRIKGGHGFQTVVHDLSMSGFCAAAVSRIRPGSVCWLTLPGMESLQGEAIWWDNSLVGVAFDRLLSPIVYEDIMARWRSKAQLRTLA